VITKPGERSEVRDQRSEDRDQKAGGARSSAPPGHDRWESVKRMGMGVRDQSSKDRDHKAQQPGTGAALF